jgi:hypothetical protein
MRCKSKLERLAVEVKKSRADKTVADQAGRTKRKRGRVGGWGEVGIEERREAVCGGGTRVVWRGRPSVQVNGGKRGTGQLVP